MKTHNNLLFSFAVILIAGGFFDPCVMLDEASRHFLTRCNPLATRLPISGFRLISATGIIIPTALDGLLPI